MSNRTLLVSGASGHLGRKAVEYLVEHAAGDTILAGTRNPAALKDLASAGVGVREMDFDRPDTMDAALAGVDGFLIVSTDALDRPGHRAEQHIRAVEAAVRAGVKHIVYTSMPNPSEANPMMLRADHKGTEEAIMSSGVTYTIIRNNWYFENLLGSLAAAVKTGELTDSSGPGRAGWISRDDCARAAGAALVSGNGLSSVRNATGQELMGLNELAGKLSAFSGRTITVKPVATEERRTQLKAAGLTEGLVEFLVNTETGIREGWLAVLTDDVKSLTGRAPMRLEAFLEAHRADILGT